jgi:ribosomal protein S18 acetylase RimI-like enzyme
VDIVVRDAVVADAPSIAAVHVAGWRWAYDGLMPASLLGELSVDRRAEGWVRSLTDALPRSVNLVAETDGSVIGFISLGAGRDDDADPVDGELMAIYISPQLAGTGVGSRLHDEGLVQLAGQGFGVARLWVLDSNARARRFYERHGWLADGATKDQAMAGGFVAHEVRYRRPLQTR